MTLMSPAGRFPRALLALPSGVVAMAHSALCFMGPPKGEPVGQHRERGGVPASQPRLGCPMPTTGYSRRSPGGLGWHFEVP